MYSTKDWYLIKEGGGFKGRGKSQWFGFGARVEDGTTRACLSWKPSHPATHPQLARVKKKKRPRCVSYSYIASFSIFPVYVLVLGDNVES